MSKKKKVVLFANTDWYLFNFRLPLIRMLVARGWEVVALSPAGRYRDRIVAEGARWVEVPLGRKNMNPVRALLSLFRVIMVLRKERPDVLHCFTLECVILGSLSGRVAGIPARVNALAGLGYFFSSTSLRAYVLRPVVRTLLRLALAGNGSRLILQNREDFSLLVESELVCRERAVLIRGSGVDLMRFQPNQGRIHRSVRALLATRLLWSKGVGDFAAVACELRESQPDLEFVLAGEPDPGNPDSVPIEQVERWRSEGVMKVLGHVEDMALLMRDVHMVVLPTTYGEGVPRTLLEAAASGLPIVASDTAGCREIVKHEWNGLLVPPGNRPALRDAIIALARDARLRETFGLAGRTYAVAEFDEQSVIDRTVAVYEQLIVHSGPAAGRV
ncbi:MAG: glycosyltransferase family 4 protein [Chromatiales bacterium]|nr:glycosyltransferase family 4 protein [Chromatiales bacterium]